MYLTTLMCPLKLQIDIEYKSPNIVFPIRDIENNYLERGQLFQKQKRLQRCIFTFLHQFMVQIQNTNVHKASLNKFDIRKININ